MSKNGEEGGVKRLSFSMPLGNGNPGVNVMGLCGGRYGVMGVNALKLYEV